jgi:CheY-like chemotaxis protein
VIDDEEKMRMLFHAALEDAGYRVLSAESGTHGLRLLQHQKVDVILVDIFMPGMDGLELIQLLRKKEPTSKIIAMSGSTGDLDYLTIAKYLGANETLKKPFSMQELLTAVAAQLSP